MADDGQEKTEHKSEKKLEQSREKGELPRSQELATFVVFATTLLYFSFIRLAWFDNFGEIMANLLSFDAYMDISRDNVHEIVLVPMARTFVIIAPLFAAIMLFSPLVNMAQTQFNIANKKLTPDWNRLDPIKGLKNKFSMRQLVEGLKSAIKITLFLYLAWITIEDFLPVINTLAGQGLRQQLNVMVDIMLTIGVRLAVLMAVLAAADYGYQWWEFQKKLRLSHQELKDEMKEREGHPMVKQRQRSIAMQRARQRMMSGVPDATVIVTNPTRIAIALTYDKSKAPAPIVTAKGKQHVAKRIREIAQENGIPIIENKPLARALFKTAKINQCVPSEFYKAVAEVLAFVFFLRQQKRQKTDWA